MAKIFSKLTFKKLPSGRIVSTNGVVSLKKLAEEKFYKEPILAITPEAFDLRLIGLKKGTYLITATTEAPSLKLEMSDPSDGIEYTIT